MIGAARPRLPDPHKAPNAGDVQVAVSTHRQYMALSLVHELDGDAHALG